MSDQISQITIYLKSPEKESERVNEIALFGPLSLKSNFDESSKTLAARKWTFNSHLPLPRLFFLKIQTFFFHTFKRFLPEERTSLGSKFRTVLAILLVQEELREFFLGSLSRKTHFFDALKKAAISLGISHFPLPDINLPSKIIATELTIIDSQEVSLIDDLVELNLQMATLKEQERNEILFQILNNIERPPITSVLEVSSVESVKIEITTKYAKFQVQKIDDKTGKIHYICEENQSTPGRQASTSLTSNGVINQRIVFENSKLIGSYCGELLTSFNVVEQLLFLLKNQNDASLFFLLENPPPLKIAEDKIVVFTSLFSWNEYEKILQEHQAIDNCHNKILKIVYPNGQEEYLKLKLLHQNIPFNALNKYPSPAETKANLSDINDSMWIQLLPRCLKYLGLEDLQLTLLAERIDLMRSECDYLKKQQVILETIDQFQPLKKQIVFALEDYPKDSAQFEAAFSLKQQLLGKKSEHKKLSGIDHLIYSSVLMKHLRVLHNKNCEHSTDKTAAATAVDKAQNAYYKIHKKFFLPQLASHEEIQLFQVLYSMYLVWEEPELNSGLSTGFIGEKFFKNFLQKNPETTRYLISWLKAHPEMYLGLSQYR